MCGPISVDEKLKAFQAEVDFSKQFELYSDLPWILFKGPAKDSSFGMHIIQYYNGVCTGSEVSSGKIYEFKIEDVYSLEEKLKLLAALEKITRTYNVTVERATEVFKIEADSIDSAKAIALERMQKIYDEREDNSYFWAAGCHPIVQP